jgi:hypothetical protein
MTDATLLLLFQEVVQNTPLRIKIDLYTGLMYIMHKVEIKPLHPTFMTPKTFSELKTHY